MWDHVLVKVDYIILWVHNLAASHFCINAPTKCVYWYISLILTLVTAKPTRSWNID